MASHSEQHRKHSDGERKRQPTYGQTIRSVLAAFLGVQSRKNWEKDMESPSPARYMVVGTVLGFVLVGLLIGITWFVTSQLSP